MAYIRLIKSSWNYIINGFAVKVHFNSNLESLVLSICAESELSNQHELLAITFYPCLLFFMWLLNMELQHLHNGCLLYKVTELPITVICLIVFFFCYACFFRNINFPQLLRAVSTNKHNYHRTQIFSTAKIYVNICITEMNKSHLDHKLITGKSRAGHCIGTYRIL